MPWLQAQLTVDKGRAPLIELLFENLGAVAVTMEDAADEPMLEPAPGETPLWQATRITGLFEGDTDADSLKNGTATGFVFDGDSSADLEQCVRRAIGYFGKRKVWHSLQRNAMNSQFDWESSARQYMALYQ